jgi:hypothetical protein
MDSINGRLARLESARDESFPSFAACCANRWRLHEWMHKLAEHPDIDRVRAALEEVLHLGPCTDDELRERLRSAKPGDGIRLPAGAIPATTDELLGVVLANAAAVKSATIKTPGDE